MDSIARQEYTNDAPLEFKGYISKESEFPSLATLKSGDEYIIKTNTMEITDTKNSGQTFELADDIVWNGEKWEILGSCLL